MKCCGFDMDLIEKLERKIDEPTIVRESDLDELKRSIDEIADLRSARSYAEPNSDFLKNRVEEMQRVMDVWGTELNNVKNHAMLVQPMDEGRMAEKLEILDKRVQDYHIEGIQKMNAHDLKKAEMENSVLKLS